MRRLTTWQLVRPAWCSWLKVGYACVLRFEGWLKDYYYSLLIMLASVVQTWLEVFNLTCLIIIYTREQRRNASWTTLSHYSFLHSRVNLNIQATVHHRYSFVHLPSDYQGLLTKLECRVLTWFSVFFPVANTKSKYFLKHGNGPVINCSSGGVVAIWILWISSWSLGWLVIMNHITTEEWLAVSVCHCYLWIIIHRVTVLVLHPWNDGIYMYIYPSTLQLRI